MDNLNEIEQLKKRIELLEQKHQNISRLLLQIGEVLSFNKSTSANNEKDKNDRYQMDATESRGEQESDQNENSNEEKNMVQNSLKIYDKKTGFDNLSRTKEEQELSVSFRAFKVKYELESDDFELSLDINRNLIRDLVRYREWGQVPERLKSMLYLQTAYESDNYYADRIKINDETLFLVAPAESDIKYTQRDFIRMALPAFFDIEFSSNLGGKMLKLINPAVFLLNSSGEYVLKTKGQIAIAQ